MIRRIQQGLLAKGVAVSIAKLCTWFGIPRRTVYYKPVKAAPKVDPRFSEPIKKMIEEEPSFGYRTVAWLLGFNKNTVQRIFQIKSWQVRKRAVLRLDRTGLGSKAELDPALSALEDGECIRPVDAPQNPQGGRPQRLYAVNPALHRGQS